MIKTIPLFASAMTLLAVNSAVFANDLAVAPSAPDVGVIAAIHQLGNRIEGLSQAGIKSVNEAAYQLDKSFATSIQLNAKQADIQNRTHVETQQATDRAIKNNLQPFAAATLTYTNKNQPEVKKVEAESNLRQKYINQLKNLDASDSIYSLVQGIDVSSYWTRRNLGAPGRNDDAFNFATLVEPEAYSPEQMKNSENFIGYATKQYQSYTDGVNLSQLRNALVQYQKQGAKALSQQIDQFRNNQTYRDYQMTVRSMVASQSVATDIFSGLAIERKPLMTTTRDAQLEAISRAAGVEPQVISLKNDNGETVTMYRYASPLQIAKFRANYRLNDPNWAQEVAGDSAENLQRKSVLLLAEISSSLYQNHLDNEKIMGALAMINLQYSQLAGTDLKAQTSSLNDAISAFAASANNTPPPPPPSSSTSSTTDTPSTITVDGATYDANSIPPPPPSQ